MSKIHFLDIDVNTEAWCAYEIEGADAKYVSCFTTEEEAAEEVKSLKKNNPKVRLVHFPAEEI